MTQALTQRFLRRCRILFLIAALVLLGAQDGWAQQFGVTVPGREVPSTSDGLPIAKIKITLEFASAPSSFTLERIDADTSVASVSSTSALPSGFGMGDEVQISQDGSTMVISLFPLSNIGSDNCERTAGGSTTINMELTGTPAISGYRLTSYRAPLTDYGCSCASRRIIDTPSQWGNGAFSTPPGTDLGRHPVTMIMVLDESGSMVLPLSSGETRMERLNQNAGNAVDLWTMMSGQPDEDELGIVYFTTGVEALTFPAGGDFLVPRNSTTSGGQWSDIASTLFGRTPKSLTAMGDGLKEAFDRKGTQEDVAIVLFTDGIENEGTFRTEACSDLPSGTCPPIAPTDRMNLWDAAGSNVESIPGQCVITQTIGLGAPGSIQNDVLDRVALQTGGLSKTGFDAEAMSPSNFQQALLNILDASSLHEVFRATSTLAAGDATGVRRTVYVSKAARQMLVSLSWYGLDQQDAMNLRFTDPGGNQRRPDDVTRRQDYLIASFDFEKEPQDGAWQVEVVRGQSEEAIEYEVAGFLDDTVLNYDLAWHQPAYFVGEPAYLVVNITENGQPADGLSADNFQFTLKRPSAGIGSLLSDQEVPEDVLERGIPKLGEDQPGSPYGRKLGYLTLEDQEFVKRITPRPTDEQLTVQPGPIELDDGTRIGGKATFVVEIPDTRVPGLYDVTMQMRGELEQSGRVQRQETIQVPIKVRPNLAASEVQADARRQAIRLQFVPKDLYENHLGPGFDDSFSVRILGREKPLESKASDQGVRGVYEMRINDVPVDEDPTLVFELNGKPFHVVTAKELVSGEIPKDPRLEKVESRDREGDDIKGDSGKDPSGGGCGRSSSGSTSGILFFFAVVVGWVNIRRRVERRVDRPSDDALRS